MVGWDGMGGGYVGVMSATMITHYSHMYMMYMIMYVLQEHPKTVSNDG